MGFNLNDYEPVEERLARFIADYPDFRIDTELESLADNQFIVKAYIYRTYADSVAFATGYAAEKVSDKGVNANFALPNAETSAIGRALANAGYAPKGKRMSREEAAHVNRVESKNDWDAFIAQPNVEVREVKQKSEPAPLEASVDILAAALGAEIVEEIPKCKHAEMRLKEGTGKTGKPYRGYVCRVSGDDQCKPIWLELDASGKWIPQKAR